jgi:hypothetical protein
MKKGPVRFRGEALRGECRRSSYLTREDDPPMAVVVVVGSWFVLALMVNG